MRRIVSSCLALTLLSPLIPVSAAPADLTWVGDTSSMNTASNWDPEQIPNAGEPHDNLTFPSAMGPERSVINDIAGSLLIGNITIEDDYVFTGANSFSILADTGYLLEFTGSNANINFGATPGMILNGTWQVTSTEDGNAIDTVLQGTTGGNLYLVQGLLELGGDNQFNGVLTIGNEVSLGMNPPAVLRATVSGAFGSTGFTPVTTLSSTATLDLNDTNQTLGTLSGNIGSSVDLGSGALTVISGSAQVPLYGVISGTGSVTVSTNELALLGANTYTGTTTITAGGHLATLNMGDTPAILFDTGGGSLVLGSNVTSDVELSFSGEGVIGVGNYTATLSGAISGDGASIAKTGPGVLILTGTNTNAGNIHVWGGILELDGQSLGNSTGFTFDPPTPTVGTLRFGNDITEITNAVALTGGPAIIDTNGNDVEISGPISGGHFFTKQGEGTLTLTAPGNNYGAKTKISKGIVNVIPAAYNTCTQTVFMGEGEGVLQLGGNYNPFAASIVLMQDGSIDTNNFEMNITGVVAGNTTSTLQKIGMGSMTLSGANIYTGPTQVVAGTLLAGAPSTFSAGLGATSGAFGVSSNITVDSGATLDFQTFANTVGTLTNAGTVASSATISTTAYTQEAAGELQLAFPTSSATPYGNISSTGAIALDGELTVSDPGGYTPTTGTEIVLLQSSGTGKQLSGTFSSVTLPAEFSSIGKVQYEYSENKVIIGIAQAHGVWESAANGNWATGANWEGGIAPGLGTPADNDSATFPDVAAMDITVTLASSDGTAAQTVTLHNINFTSTMTDYTIEPFNASSQILLASPNDETTKPSISMSADAATINAPVVMQVDSRIYLSNGTLTFGASSTFTGNAQTLYISEGDSTATLVNDGSMTPFAIVIDGGTVVNHETMAPTSQLTIGAAGAGDIIVANAGTMSTTGTITFLSGTTTNQNGGTIQSTNLVVNGGALINETGATLGSTSSSLTLTSGLLQTETEVEVKSYTQSSTGSISLDFPTNMDDPFGNIATTGSIQLNGTLTVTDTGNFMPSAGNEFILFSSSGTGKQIQGSFASVTLPAEFSPEGSIHYDYSENQVILSIASANGVWESVASGNWATNGNWEGDVAPGIGSMAADHDSATFPNVASSAITVTLATDDGSSAQSVTLHDLIFSGSTTSYTLEQFSASSEIILDAGGSASKPRITVQAGTHTINAPIVLNTDSRIYLGGGALILGDDAAVTGASTLYISEGIAASMLTNNGSITPQNVVFDGGSFTNNASVSTAGSITISALEGLSSALQVINNGQMQAGTNLALTKGTLLTSEEILAATYSQGASGILQLNIEPQKSNLLKVSGSTSLNGALVVNTTSFTNSNLGSFPLITSDSSISGQFQNVSYANLPHDLIPSLSYQPDTVFLTTKPSVPNHFSASTHMVFSSILQHTAFINRKNFQLRNRATTPIAARSESTAEAPKKKRTPTWPTSLKRQLPDSPLPADALLAQAEAPQRKEERLAETVRSAKSSQWNVYAAPLSSFGHVDSLGDQVGFGYTSAGGFAGFDVAFPRDRYNSLAEGGIGAIVEYRYQWAEASQNAGNINSSKLHTSLYGTLMPTSTPELFFDFVTGFAYTWDSMTRNTGFANELEAKSSTNEEIFVLQSGVEYFGSVHQNFSVTPLFQVQYVFDHVDGYKEHGAGSYNLSAAPQEIHSLLTILGARFNFYHNSATYKINLEFDAQWLHEYLSNQRNVLFTPYNVTNVPTTILAPAAPRNSALLALDLLTTFHDTWQLEANGTLVFNNLFYDAFFFLSLGRLF